VWLYGILKGTIMEWKQGMHARWAGLGLVF